MLLEEILKLEDELSIIGTKKEWVYGKIDGQVVGEIDVFLYNTTYRRAVIIEEKRYLTRSSRLKARDQLWRAKNYLSNHLTIEGEDFRDYEFYTDMGQNRDGFTELMRLL